MIGVSVLGSSGSIGKSTLDVLRRHPEQFRVIALGANRDVETLQQQCLEFTPDHAVMADPDAARNLQLRLKAAGVKTQVSAGVENLERIAALDEVDYVMAAIVGAAGLLPTLAGVRAGKRILLANKESLVVAGELFMREAAEHHAQILPIDSEHNAVFQCMPGDFNRGLERVGVERILLTASGGPFRSLPLERLQRVTPEQACAHPNWSMGRKISVDSATMMNKGLEVIEACWLFHTTSDRIRVVVHPQSVIHSMVEYCDGSVLAQLGNPDMRTPIAHALAWPERIDSGVGSLDLFEVARFDFEAPDLVRFPCLKLAYQAIETAGTAPAVLNAANEMAVEAFLTHRIGFQQIPQLIQEALDKTEIEFEPDLDRLLEVDRVTRRRVEQSITALV